MAECIMCIVCIMSLICKQYKGMVINYRERGGDGDGDGATKQEGGGQVKFYTYKKGSRKGFGVVLTRVLEVLTIMKGYIQRKGFHPSKVRGGGGGGVRS